ncbi:hypothetical protein B9Z19DRAFT_1121833 [Tuber borchii]|uniref:Uncharacterized protein n=1 Tax=Tuber borchii TaxID=42251 RepID=A0A2T7A1S2_TUBBO|nr:hypothetical protein B9Z19DRAFT_1121833 [Tuber borchii]
MVNLLFLLLVLLFSLATHLEAPTVDAWIAGDVDQKLKEWWESIPDRTDRNFVSELGKAFGDFEYNLACRVDTEDQCVNPSCNVFLGAKAPKWTYFVQVAISNLNRFMRLLHSDLEKFFKKLLVAWFVNSEIRTHTKTFILCSNSIDPESVGSPSEAKYITCNGTRVCNLYRLDSKGELRDLIAVETLKQPEYNITARDMVHSSVEAYLAKGLNCTAEEMTSRLQISATLPPDQQWFSQGAAGEGAFTIPVYDVGKNTEWMGSGMTCFCEVGCEDTKSFMESAKMGSFDPVKNECEKIFPVSKTLDYGISNAPSLSKASWRTLAGVFFATVVANFLLD